MMPPESDADQIPAAVEAALREVGQLRRVTDAAPLLLSYIDAAGHYRFANRAYEDWFGHPRAEVLGKTMQEVLGAAAYAALRPYVQTALSGERVSFEQVVSYKDAGTRSIRATYVPDRDEQGQIQGFVAIVDDITQARRAEGALRESEARKGALLEAALDCIVMMDHQGKVIEFNPAAERTFGYSRGEAIGQEMARLIIPPSLHEAHRRGLARYLATGEGVIIGKRLELTAMRADGSEFAVELTITRVSRVSVEGPPVFMGFLRDITERQRTEEALQRREREFASLVESSPDIISRFDRDLRCRYTSPAVEAATGLPPEFFLGKTHWEMGLPPQMCAQAEECLRRIFATGQMGTIEFTLPSPTGTRYFDASGVPEFAPDGSVESVMTVSRDITERRRAEAAVLARARQQSAVAELGVRALSGVDLSALMDQATRLVAGTLEVELCKVLQLLPDGKEVLLVAGVGWKEGLVGRGRVSTGLDSQAGYTLLSNEPVIVEELRTETRFTGPPLLHEHGVISGISCIIPQRGGQPFGVLGAHTRKRRTFTKDDTHFLQSIANVLATAVERQRAEEERRVFLRDVLRSMSEGKLTLCDSAADLPPRLPAAGEPVALAQETLRALRVRTLEAARAQGFDKDRGNDLVTAVGEAGMNAVVHAKEGVAYLGVGASGTVQVWIEDRGAGIAPERLHRATLERGYSTGTSLGHGFWLMLQTIDRLWLLTGPEGTTLVLEQEKDVPAPDWAGGR